MTSNITPSEARAKTADLSVLSDEELAECWQSIARQISYLNADDYGKDWKDVPKWRPSLNAIDDEFDLRGLARPDRAGFLL